MQSRTSFFSAAIFRKNISRFYLLALLYLAAQCVALPLILQTTLSGYAWAEKDYNALMYRAVQNIYQSTEMTLVVALCGAVVSAMAVFSYLYSARSANMMASLPIRRESMFVSCVASIYAVVIASNVIACLLALLVTMPMGLMLGKWIMQWFFIVLGQFTLFFGIAVLCAVVTGSVLAMPAIYVVVNFISVGLCAVMTSILSSVVYGVRVAVPRFFIWLSPFVSLISGRAVHYDQAARDLLSTQGTDISYVEGSYNIMSYGQSKELIAYAIAGVIMLVIAMLIHRKRHMETAGDVVSVKILRPVFKILFAVGLGIVGGYLFYELFFYYGRDDVQAYKLMGCIGVFAIIGYILAEMMIQKRSRISIKNVAAPALIIAALLICGIWCADADVFGVEKFVPSVDEVKTANISINGEHVEVTDAENIGLITSLHQIALDNKDVDSNIPWSYNFTVVYELTNGKSVSRYYGIFALEAGAEAAIEPAERLLNSPEAIIQRHKTGIEISVQSITGGGVNVYDPDEGSTNFEFDSKQMYELYSTCIYPDMLDGNIGTVEVDNWQNGGPSDILIEMYLIDPNREYSTYDKEYGMPSSADMATEWFQIAVLPESARTIAWLENNGVNCK